MINAVKATYNVKHNYWVLERGKETFYDEQRFLRTWKTKQDAIDWLKSNHPELMFLEERND